MTTSKFNSKARTKRTGQYETKLRKIRQKLFDYEGTGKEENGGPSAWIFYGTEAGEYPDSVLSFGPRGGLRVQPA